MANQYSDKKVLKIVSAIIVKDHKILLALRKNTLHYPDYWSLPVGHVEEGETNEAAIYRELQEELGIQVTRMKALQFHQDKKDNIEHQVFFIQQWQGEVVNREADLCEAINFFSFQSLPKKITPISLTIIKQYTSNLIT